MAKIISSSSSSSFFFRWASSKLHDSVTMVSHEIAAIYTEQCTSPLLFHSFEATGLCALKRSKVEFYIPELQEKSPVRLYCLVICTELLYYGMRYDLEIRT